MRFRRLRWALPGTAVLGAGLSLLYPGPASAAVTCSAVTDGTNAVWAYVAGVSASAGNGASFKVGAGSTFSSGTYTGQTDGYTAQVAFVSGAVVGATVTITQTNGGTPVAGSACSAVIGSGTTYPADPSTPTTTTTAPTTTTTTAPTTTTTAPTTTTTTAGTTTTTTAPTTTTTAPGTGPAIDSLTGSDLGALWFLAGLTAGSVVAYCWAARS